MPFSLLSRPILTACISSFDCDCQILDGGDSLHDKKHFQNDTQSNKLRGAYHNEEAEFLISFRFNSSLLIVYIGKERITNLRNIIFEHYHLMSQKESADYPKLCKNVCLWNFPRDSTDLNISIN